MLTYILIAIPILVIGILIHQAATAPIECKWCERYCKPGQGICDECRTKHNSPHK